MKNLNFAYNCLIFLSNYLQSSKKIFTFATMYEKEIEGEEFKFTEEKD